MIAAIPATSVRMPAKITQPRMLPSLSPPVKIAALIVCELMALLLLLVSGLFDRFLDGCERLLQRRPRLVDDDLSKDRPFGPVPAVLFGALARKEVEPAARDVGHADRDVQRGMEVMTGVQLLDGDRRHAAARVASAIDHAVVHPDGRLHAEVHLLPVEEAVAPGQIDVG